MSLREEEWVHQYNSLKRKVQSKRQTGQTFQAAEIKDLNDNLEFIYRNLQTMLASPMEYEISASELARRQLVTENLRKQITMLPITGKNMGSAPGSGKSSARNSESSSSSKGAGGGGGGSNIIGGGGSTTNPMATSDRGLVQRQHEIIQLQDDMLHDISKGVDRLHNQALEIGTSVKEQNVILKELDTDVDKTAIALTEEARHAEEVQKKSSVCKMYMCIALEVVVLVIILIMLFMKPGGR